MSIFNTALYDTDELERIGRLIGFDAAHYQAAYPDVTSAGVDPLRHFLNQGVGENRLPAPMHGSGDGAARGMGDLLGFDANFYAAVYPDTATDPLQHLLDAGMRERRLPFALERNATAEQSLWRTLERHRIRPPGSLEGQAQFDPADWRGMADELCKLEHRAGVPFRPYRNNFWLGVGIGLLAEGKLGLAACCYNFFFNGYIPLAALGNGGGGAVLTGRLLRTVDALTLPERATDTPAKPGARARRPRPREAMAATVSIGEPCFLNRIGVPPPPSDIALPVPVYGTLSDVELVGGSSLIRQGDHRLLYDYTDATGDRPRELQCPSLIHVLGEAAAAHWPARTMEVDEAFSLLHDHSHNYHHWLLEVLPRYLFAREQGLDPDVKLLVEDRLAPQKREILRLLFPGDPPLVELPPGVAASVRRLHWASDLCHNSVHTMRAPARTDIVFAPHAIALLRALAAPFLADPEHPPARRYDRLMVLRRNVGFRRLINRGLLEQAMHDLGFWGFDTGAARWADQVRVFSNARLIVAEAGAALANIAFCRPGATIVVLVNGHPHSNYFYLTQLASLVGARLYFYECLRLEGSHSIGVQDDMIVPIGPFTQQLRRFLPTGAERTATATATALKPEPARALRGRQRAA